MSFQFVIQWRESLLDFDRFHHEYVRISSHSWLSLLNVEDLVDLKHVSKRFYRELFLLHPKRMMWYQRLILIHPGDHVMWLMNELNQVVVEKMMENRLKVD